MRFFIALEDWKWGHFFQVGNFNWHQWKAGDTLWYDWRHMPHSTANAGQKPRYMCIPAYVLDPWRVNTPEHSKAIYGKVLPIHLERNTARSDGLAD